MKKKTIWATVAVALLLAMGLTGCGDGSGGGGGGGAPPPLQVGGPPPLNTPVITGINDEFDLSWNTVTDAVLYRISINDGEPWRTLGAETNFHLGIDPVLALADISATHRVQVRAVPASSDSAHSESAYSSYRYFQTAHYVFTFDPDDPGKITGLTSYGKKLSHIVIPSKVAVNPDNVQGEQTDVTTIGEGAFENNDNLETVEIPYTVETVEDNAFKNNSKLHTVNFRRSKTEHGSITTLGDDVFDNCDDLEDIHVPVDSVDDYEEVLADYEDKVSASMVTGVTLSSTAIELILVDKTTETLTATVSPAEAANKKVTWTTSNSNVATVDTNGKVAAVSTGTATITVTTADGGYKATCTVTVKAFGEVEEITYQWKNEGEVMAEAEGPENYILSKSDDDTLTITAINGYTPVKWFVNSVSAQQGGTTYTFSAAGKANGVYSVGLMATKGGITYNDNLTITVTD